MRINGNKNNLSYYFLGIGGISMSALAQYLIKNGYKVSGYDDFSGEQISLLRRLGIDVYTSDTVEQAIESLKSSDVVVYTDAIQPNHFLFAYALNSSKKMISRGDFLGGILKNFTHSIGVSGSHGKTTCTAMCAHVLQEANVPFSAHIGGLDVDFGNFYSNGTEYFLTEACEYKKNILKLACESAIVLNIDADHMECYSNEEDLIKTFKSFCKSSSKAFVCADDKNCQKLGEFPSFGIDNQFSDYRAVNLKSNGEKYQFTVQEYGKDLCRVRLNARGRCNVYNALATFSLMRSYGFDEKEIARGIENFSAVKRRFEEMGRAKGVIYICDYAHHPKEILSTVKTAQGVCEGNLYVIFQPHTYSRTKNLMGEFVESLRNIENLAIYKTYPAREYFDETGSAKTLADNVGGCLYFEHIRELKTWIKRTAKAGDTLLFLGAGDIYFIAERILLEMQS
ncbi:MAG: UDP-N-acetylmuramate--L-alanine ligase [Clostridiales bacterium]|nr:UDP-N-acetylmuramate--L-alanine ligase [Clostridiales bacterium]